MKLKESNIHNQKPWGLLYFLKDVLKCGRLALMTSSVLTVLSLIPFLIFSQPLVEVLNSLKNIHYYAGCFGLFLSAAFFIQKNADRPLEYQEQWKDHFSRLPLGFVIFFFSLCLCLYGLCLQLFIEG